MVQTPEPGHSHFLSNPQVLKMLWHLSRLSVALQGVCTVGCMRQGEYQNIFLPCYLSGLISPDSVVEGAAAVPPHQSLSICWHQKISFLYLERALESTSLCLLRGLKGLMFSIFCLLLLYSLL